MIAQNTEQRATAQSYSDSFSMYPPRSSGYEAFKKRGNWSTTLSRKTHQRSGPRLLGAAQGNVRYRQGMRQGKGGEVRRTSSTDAILYEQASSPGSLGYTSAQTGRYRNQNQSRGWRFPLTQSTGPNKAPHNIAQSSLDSTKAVYATKETRFGKTGFYDTNEQWNAVTKKFEREWKGWNQLNVKQRRQHYTLNAATMFKDKSKNKGPARRAKRKFL